MWALFTIYSSKLFQVIRNHLPDAHAYADDSELYLSFKPDSQVSQDEALNAMERCVDDIRTWMTVDKLRMNEGKTGFLVVGNKQQLCKVNIDHLTLVDQKSTPQARPRPWAHALILILTYKNLLLRLAEPHSFI